MRGRDAGLSFGRDRQAPRTRPLGDLAGIPPATVLPDGDYHALMAHARATRKARRLKDFRLNDHRLCSMIETWMDDGWSPRLISQMLAHDYPDDKLMQVSHETIYQCL